MAIEGISGGFAAQFVDPTRAIEQAQGPERANGPAGQEFGDKLGDAIETVDDRQQLADEALLQLGSGDNASLHGSMVALTEAEIALRTMVSVRDKVVSAYEQIMNMSI